MEQLSEIPGEKIGRRPPRVHIPEDVERSGRGPPTTGPAGIERTADHVAHRQTPRRRKLRWPDQPHRLRRCSYKGQNTASSLVQKAQKRRRNLQGSRTHRSLLPPT